MWTVSTNPGVGSGFGCGVEANGLGAEGVWAFVVHGFLSLCLSLPIGGVSVSLPAVCM